MKERYEILNEKIQNGTATEEDRNEFKYICQCLLEQLMLDNVEVFKRLKDR